MINKSDSNNARVNSYQEEIVFNSKKTSSLNQHEPEISEFVALVKGGLPQAQQIAVHYNLTLVRRVSFNI